MHNITITFKYTKEQVANLYHYGIFPTPKAKYYLACYSLAIFGISTLAMFSRPDSIPILINVISIVKIILICCALLWCIVLINIAFNYFFMPSIAFNKSPAYQGKFIVTISEDGLAFIQEINNNETMKITEGKIKWSEFTHKAESTTFIMLYKGRKSNALPKSSFKSALEVDEFRVFLNQQNYIKPKKFNGQLLWGKM